jgi:hypothetical protein
MALFRRRGRIARRTRHDTDERESNCNTETNAHAFADTFAFSRSAK